MKNKIRKVMVVLLTAMFVMLTTKDSYAQSCNFTHYVTCDCCLVSGGVTHNINVVSATNVITSHNVFSGTVNEIQTWLHVEGKCGDVWDDDITVGCNRLITSSYHWGAHYDLRIVRARCDFGIRTDKATNWVNGFWLGV